MAMLLDPSSPIAPRTVETQDIDDYDLRPHLQARWARTARDVDDAQHLRWRVFVDGMGARVVPPPGAPDRCDVDRLDAFCEHLVVRAFEGRHDRRGRVVGTCRILTPDAALRAGGLASDDLFDLAPMDALRPHLIEVGRACVDPRHRQGTITMMMWRWLDQFMSDNHVRWALASPRLPMRDGGHTAASLWHHLAPHHAAPVAMQVRARRPLPLDHLRSDLPVEPPPLVRSYLRCGAGLLGAPAWDSDLGSAELPMLIDGRARPARTLAIDLDG